MFGIDLIGLICASVVRMEQDAALGPKGLIGGLVAVSVFPHFLIHSFPDSVDDVFDAVVKQ